MYYYRKHKTNYRLIFIKWQFKNYALLPRVVFGRYKTNESILYGKTLHPTGNKRHSKCIVYVTYAIQWHYLRLTLLLFFILICYSRLPRQWNKISTLYIQVVFITPRKKSAPVIHTYIYTEYHMEPHVRLIVYQRWDTV